jgi:DUF4097 and DUF4098 domain-containing protein YvlB
MFLAVLMFLALTPSDNPDQWSRSFKVEGPARLRVESGDANIHVSSREGGSIEARVTTENWKIGPGGIQILDRQNGNEVEIDVRFPRQWVQFNFHRRRVDIDLVVPQHISLDLHAGDGNIDVRGVKGDSAIRSGDGHIVIEDVAGSWKADTGYGGVRLARTDGAFFLRSGDGKIEVEDFDGSLHVQTGDGPVRVSGRFDMLDVKTGDGRVEATAQHGSKVASDWTLKTGDGGLTMHVPDELAADVELHTGDGHIELGVPVTIQGRTDQKTIRGKLNAGGRLLTIQTGDGSIRLLKL